MATTTLAAASTRNGIRHVECAAIQSPAGTPATAASENDVATMPVAVARRANGTRSATIASTRPPMTPPKVPATIRAASSSG